MPGAQSRQTVHLSYRYKGSPVQDWKIVDLEATDAEGNLMRESALAPTWPCTEYSPPSPNAPYRLRVGVQKTVYSDFDPDELWTVADVTLPINGNEAPVQQRFDRENLHLTVEGVYGMDGRKFNSDLAVVKLMVDSPLKNLVILLHVEDEQGRTIASPWPAVNREFGPDGTFVVNGKLTVFHKGFLSDQNPKYRSAPLQIPKGVKRLKLFFKLPRTHFVEFVVPGSQPEK